MSATPVRSLARWRRQRGGWSQLPKAEVVLVDSLAQNGAGFSKESTQHINSLLQSVSIHAALGGGWPRWQPLNGTDRHALWARCQLESVLAAGYGDGGIQLRPDDYSARSSAGERLAAATAERTSFVGDGF